MSAVPAAPQDDEILTLFRQWIEAMRAVSRISSRSRYRQSELDAVSDRISRIEREILDAPAQGAGGFAVKDLRRRVPRRELFDARRCGGAPSRSGHR